VPSASVTIDAGVLAVPREDGDVHHYVEVLLDWSELLDEPWVAIYMSEMASQELLIDDLYPLREQLSKLFATNRVVEYDVNTVATVVDRLLQMTPQFETYFRIRDVLTEDLTIEPDVLRLCSGRRLQSDLGRCVILIAILREHCRQSISEHSLILRNAPARILHVRAKIHEIDHDRDDIGQLPIPPECFEGKVLVCEDFKGLLACLEECVILLRAEDDLGIRTAIRVALFKSRLANGFDPDWNDMPSFSIGNSFRESFHRNHPTEDLAGRLLRAIIETLEQINLSATHWLRAGSGGKDPQRMRSSDQAKAWRRDVDRDYHLHYWVSQDHTVEFAWLGYPHDDFTIPE
jgi:hypothetical protein